MDQILNRKHKYGISDNEGLSDYSKRNKPEFNRLKTVDTTFDYLNNINWESEVKYHSAYKGFLPGRTIGGSKKQIEHLINKYGR